MDINKILCGDSLEVLKDFKNNYFDSVVTDPPYGLAFMGKKWDYDVPEVELWKEVYRVLKSGGHLLSFAGSRTYHRMAVNIEDAGFEIRDMLGWLYGSGFPKSHNIGKAVDKIQGNKREEVEEEHWGRKNRNKEYSANVFTGNRVNDETINKRTITKGNSQWEGWGTALKPAHEPIVMARKPFNTSVAENVLTHGTGGINIDECRVGTESIGRFPANIIHDGSEEVLEIFPETKSGTGAIRKNAKGLFGLGGDNKPNIEYDDKGSAARFFYCAKASKAERNMGLDDYEEKQVTDGTIRSNQETARTFGANSAKRKNYHPTVKPIKLMEYLVRLITPKEGIVLEPFAGSGTTLIACKQQGFNYIGIEREQEYCDIAEARLKAVQVQGELF